MSTADPAPRTVQLHYVLRCPCGETLTGDTEDDIVDVSFAHLRARHPDKAAEYERDHILFMAQRLVRGDRPS
jgi:hypothetical protein